MTDINRAGISPVNDSFLRALEVRLTERLAKLVPPFIGTKTLTLLTFLSSALIVLSYYLATKARLFVLFASFFVVTQWIFDCLDGTIGRLRGEGFVRWGFYMDHLFDYLFMASIIFGFYLLFPGSYAQIFILFFISSFIMVSFFLMHDATRDREKDFVISFGGLSPIEFRLSVIVFNAIFCIAPVHTAHFVSRYLGYLNALLLLSSIVVIYYSQKRLSRYDLSEKAAQK